MAGVCWRQLGYTGSERDHTGGNRNCAGTTGITGNEHAESTWDILGVRARVIVWLSVTYVCVYIFISIHSFPALCPLHFLQGSVIGIDIATVSQTFMCLFQSRAFCLLLLFLILKEKGK